MAGSLRKRFKNSEVTSALTESTLIDAAHTLTSLGRGTVSPQLLGYWKKHLDGKKSSVDRDISDGVVLRTPSMTDFLRTLASEAVKNSKNACILNIPDQHSPYHHPDTISFLSAVKCRFPMIDRVLNLGDETDGHALSMHDSDPSLASAGHELVEARKFIHELEALFPVMDICHSNHGSLIYRRAFKSGIPAEYIKPYRDFLFPDGGGKGWEWADRFDILLPNGERVIYQHQSAGDILNNAAHEEANIVQGHEHGKFEIRSRANTHRWYWSMISGCLIDHKARAFAYGKLFPNKPIIGCTMVINSVPYLIPMELNSDGRWTGRLL